MAIIDDYASIVRRMRELRGAASVRSEALGTAARARENLMQATVSAHLGRRGKSNNGGSIMPRNVPIYVGRRQGGASSSD
jgi:hypothetical protein